MCMHFRKPNIKHLTISSNSWLSWNNFAKFYKNFSINFLPICYSLSRFNSTYKPNVLGNVWNTPVESDTYSSSSTTTTTIVEKQTIYERDNILRVEWEKNKANKDRERNAKHMFCVTSPRHNLLPFKKITFLSCTILLIYFSLHFTGNKRSSRN